MATSPQDHDDPVSLSIRQQRAIVALGAGASKVEAAKAAGVARETVHEWLRNPQFRQAVQLESDAMLDATRTRFRGLADKAADVLERHLDHPNFEAALRAAGIITKELKLFSSRKEVTHIGIDPEVATQQLMEAIAEVTDILNEVVPGALEQADADMKAAEAALEAELNAELTEEPKEAGETPLDASNVAPEPS